MEILKQHILVLIIGLFFSYSHGTDVASFQGDNRPNICNNVGFMATDEGHCSVIAVSDPNTGVIGYYTALHCLGDCDENRNFQAFNIATFEEARVEFPHGTALIQNYYLPNNISCSIPGLDCNPDFARIDLLFQTPGNVRPQQINGLNPVNQLAWNLIPKSIGYPGRTTIKNRNLGLIVYDTNQSITADWQARHQRTHTNLGNGVIFSNIKTEEGESGGALVNNNMTNVYGILSGGGKKTSMYEPMLNIVNAANYGAAVPVNNHRNRFVITIR